MDRIESILSWTHQNAVPLVNRSMADKGPWQRASTVQQFPPLSIEWLIIQMPAEGNSDHWNDSMCCPIKQRNWVEKLTKSLFSNIDVHRTEVRISHHLTSHRSVDAVLICFPVLPVCSMWIPADDSWAHLYPRLHPFHCAATDAGWTWHSWKVCWKPEVTAETLSLFLLRSIILFIIFFPLSRKLLSVYFLKSIKIRQKRYSKWPDYRMVESGGKYMFTQTLLYFWTFELLPLQFQKLLLFLIIFESQHVGAGHKTEIFWN